MFGGDKQAPNPLRQPKYEEGTGDKDSCSNLFQGPSQNIRPLFGGMITDKQNVFGALTTKTLEKPGNTSADKSTFMGSAGLFGKPTSWPVSSSKFGQNESKLPKGTFGSRTVVPDGKTSLRARSRPASQNPFSEKHSPEKDQKATRESQGFGKFKLGTTGTSFRGSPTGKQDVTPSQLGLKYNASVSKQLSKEPQDTPLTSSVRGALFGKKTTKSSTILSAFEGDRKYERERTEDIKNTSEETGEVTNKRMSSSALRKPKIKREGIVPRPETSGPGLFGKAITGLTGMNASVSRSRKDGEDSGSLAKQSSAGIRRRSTSSKDKSSLIVKRIPDKYNNRQWLTKHFRKYGKLTKVLDKPATKSAFIYYEDHASAAQAKKRGAFIGHDDEPLNIFFVSNSPRILRKSSSKVESISSEGMITEGNPSGSRSTTRTKEIARSSLRQDNSDVDEELKALQGTTDNDEEQVIIPDRPGMDETIGKSDNRVKRGGTLVQIQKDISEKGRSVSPLRRMGDKTTRELDPSKAREESHFGKDHSDQTPVSANVLLHARANTVEEKIKILESRDKLLKPDKGSRKSNADVATAKVVHGTCQDMCPEKERYLREARRRLSVFEIIPGTDIGRQNSKVDHARAVKEYSRSSADQDMPLPHELRPPHVLNITMNYLMNNIMDQGEDGKWGDWYDFLWNRTRSIRKDITQQMLCNKTSVDLTEKCARFHIYCAERLVEEGAMDFDTKINNENLTKCLQSLKELYSDLERQSIVCPNEAEFRGYIILMNLNGGDILRETQQLREDIRRHPSVVFALKVHSALNCNNYIRFFNLVRRATFLNACIMHRYFNQMRRLALLVFCKVYTNKPCPYPLLGLMTKLAFENEDEVARCCEHHGLTVEDDNVIFEKRAFVNPETAFERKRAIKLIESKLHTSVGELVNGGPLPANHIHIPTYSFDEHGQFIPPAELDSLSEDKETGEQSDQQAITESSIQISGDGRSQEIPTKPTLYSSDIIKDVANSICHEVSDTLVKEMCSDFLQRITTILTVVRKLQDDTIDSTTNALIRQIASEVISEEKAEVERKKRETLTEAATVMALDQLMEVVVTEQCQAIARDTLRQVEIEKEERRKMFSELILQELLKESLSEEVSSVSREVYDKDVKQRLEQIDEASKHTLLLRQLRFFNIWKSRYARRMRLKGSMLNFPPAPPLRNTAEQVKDLIPKSEGLFPNCISLDSRTKLALRSQAQLEEGSYRISLTIALYNFIRHIKHQKAWAPVNMIDAIGKPLFTKTKQTAKNLYWKLLISLPEYDTSVDASETLKWITTKFRKGAVPLRNTMAKSEVLSLYTTPMEDSGREVANVSVCVRTSEGIVDPLRAEEIQEKRCFQGTCAILFFLSISDTTYEFWEIEKQRLGSILSSMKPIPALPLGILVQSDVPVTKDLIIDKLNLHKYKLVSEFKFFFIEDIEDLNASGELNASVQWLAEKNPNSPQLDYDPIREYVEKGLGKIFFPSLYQDLATRRKQGQLDQNPQAIVALYNSVVRTLSQVATSDALTAYSWPIPEFATHEKCDLPSPDWNSEHQLDYLEDLILSLGLPEFNFDNMNTESWEAAVADVWQFVSVLTSNDNVSVADLHSRINWILQKTEWEYEDNCDFYLGKFDQPFYVNMPWSEIMLSCIHFKLATLNWRSPTDEEGFDSEIMIPYKGQELEEKFKLPKEWIEVVKKLNEADQTTVNDTLYKSETLQSGKRKHSGDDGDSPPKQARVHSQDEQDDITNNINSTISTKLDFSVQWDLEMEITETAQTLKTSIAIERQKHSQYEAYLERMLAGDLEKDSFENNSLNMSVSISPLQRYKSHSELSSTPGGSREKGKESFFSSGFGQSMQITRVLGSYGSPQCNGSKSQSDSMIVNVSTNENGNLSLQEEIEELKEKIESHRREETIFEMKVKSALIQAPLKL